MNIFTNEIVRGIISGQISAKKCPCCDNNGQEWWDGMTGLGVGSAPPVGVPVENLSNGDCENCDGLAYLIARN